MVTIKIFDAYGLKNLKCFDTLPEVPYIVDSDDEEINDQADETDDGF